MSPESVTATAWVRGVPESFGGALAARPPDPALDVELASDQHASYVVALEAGGYDIRRIPIDDSSPDSAFVEDTAVVVGDRALITRPGHESRRYEVDPVAETLRRSFKTTSMRSPATLDGGDVLVVGDQVLIGLSTRTNRHGASAVAALAEPQGFTVTVVEVGEVLHLKSGLSAIDDATVLWHPASCDRSELEGLRVVEVRSDDPESANVVRLADGAVLVAEAHSATAELLDGIGVDVRRVDVSEFGRADGGLTCLSIRIR